MSDKIVKDDLRNLLAEAFDISPDNVVKSTTTDLIVKVSENEHEWFYFEVKSTNKTKRKIKNKYFGAISLNQLVEAEKHKGRYYFILASESDCGRQYALASPPSLISYLTGYYLHADFSIPDSELEAHCVNSDSFKNICRGVRQDISIFHDFPSRSVPSKDKIEKLTKLIVQQNNGTDKCSQL